MAVAVISLFGTVAGSGGSIIMANKLISYRLSKLEELVKVQSGDAINILRLEKDTAVLRENVKDIEQRLEKIERRS